MTRVIGLIGAKRAGKDTVAARLVEKHGFRRVAHADALKEAALAIDPLVGRDGLRLSELVNSIGWEAAKNYPEVRRTLQRLGQTVRAVAHENVWAERIEERLYRANYGGPPVVVSDVRLPNEVAQVKKWRGIIVRVKRPANLVTSSELDQHVSERALDDYPEDFALVNDSTVASLWAKVDNLVASL